MKFLLYLSVAVLAIVLTMAADEEKEEERTLRIFQRLIPADTLRDFPGMCFASTRCEVFAPNATWDLSPFCGRSTCVLPEEKDGHLLELVEDCGPLPKPNDKCKLSEKTQKSAPFPECCPQFECEEGVTLEYPEVPTVAASSDAETKA